MIVYEPIPLSLAKSDFCNVCNLSSDITDDDYHNRLSLTHKDSWVQFFPDPKGTIVIILSIGMIKTLFNASKVSTLSGKRPRTLADELHDIENYIQLFLDDKKYFVRLSACSPKDGIYNCGPLTSAESIVDTIITSKRIHSVFPHLMKEGMDVNLYCVPWREDWCDDGEFRVFVHQGNITAISQYVWSADLGWSEELLEPIIQNIIEYCYTHIIPLANNLTHSYVIDIMYMKEPELVELNSFGREYAAGSALFHWDDDAEILYGNGQTVVVRFVDGSL